MQVTSLGSLSKRDARVLCVLSDSEALRPVQLVALIGERGWMYPGLIAINQALDAMEKRQLVGRVWLPASSENDWQPARAFLRRVDVHSISATDIYPRWYERFMMASNELCRTLICGIR